MKRYKIGKESNDKNTKSKTSKEKFPDEKNKKDEKTKEMGNSEPSPAARSKVTPEKDIEASDNSFNDYNDVFTLTQDKSIEVSWDWNSTVKSKNNDRTPKRTKLTNNKRISNSPLLYNSTKRKIIRKDNTNALDKLKADMMELQATITQKKNASNSGAAQSNNSNNISNDDNNDLDIPEEYEFDEFDDEAVPDVSKPTDLTSTNIRRSDGDICNVENKDNDDVFDQDMEASMIRCSQEVENRLVISPPVINDHPTKPSNGSNPANNFNRSNSSNESVKLPGTSKCQPQSTYKSIPASKSYNYLHPQASISKLVSQENNAKLIKHKSDPITKPPNGSRNGQNTTSNVHVKSDYCTINSEDFVDDFFDDDALFKDLEDVDFTGTISNKSTNAESGKVNSSNEKSTSKATIKSSLFIPKVPAKSSTSFPMVQPKCNTNITNRNISVPTMRPTGTIPKNSQVYSNNSSNYNNINSNNNRTIQRIGSGPNLRPNNPPNVGSQIKTQDRKFFKSKSISDSSFEHKTGLKVNATNSNSRGSGSRMFASASVSNEHLADRRTTPGLDSNSGGRNIVKNNTQLYNNVNRFGERRNEVVTKNNNTIRQTSKLPMNGMSTSSSSSSSSLSSSREVSSGLQTLQICTPKEIERKRLEAKMKLEARKKRLQASKIDSSGSFVKSNER